MDTSEIADAYAIAEQYKMLHDDKGAPTLQDAIVLATPGRVKLPKSLSEAHIYFQNFRVALHVLLGNNHALTKAYDVFWRRWSTSQQYLLSVVTQQPGMFPTLAVRWVQLRISLWFAQQAMMNDALEAPDFAELLNQIRLHMHWEPAMPSHYYNTRTMAPNSTTTTILTTNKLPEPTTTAMTTTTTAASLPPAKSRGSVIRKASPIIPALQKFVDMNLRVRDVLVRAGAANRIPTNNAGVEMCLSYHLKGMCNTNCARSADHKEHQTSEDQAIVRWCELHYKPE
jgi:hypothetical protein